MQLIILYSIITLNPIEGHTPCVIAGNEAGVRNYRRADAGAGQAGFSPPTSTAATIDIHNPPTFPSTPPPSTKSTKRRRTTPERISFSEDCYYLAEYCMKAYDTGQVCGRTLYYKYQNFTNYCMLDFVNCMERYQVWQVVHMGACYEVQLLSDYEDYKYMDDYFLDEYYVVDND